MKKQSLKESYKNTNNENKLMNLRLEGRNKMSKENRKWRKTGSKNFRNANRMQTSKTILEISCFRM